MSLPITCRSAGHQWSKAAMSSGKPAPGHVVDEGVVPDVDLAGLRVPRAVLALGGLAVLGDRERDAPVAGRALARDREVLQAAADEAEHLVAPEVRLDEVRMVGVVALQAILVGRQPEEPVPLGQPLERDLGVVRADRPAGGLLDVGGVAEPLVRAVPALVRAEVDVAVGVRPPDELLGGQDVVGIGRPDEPVRADREGILGRLEVARPSRRRSPAGDRPSSIAVWAMLIECSSVPVRKRVSTPSIRCQRAMTSAPITSYSVWTPGWLFAYAMAVVR